MNSQEFTTHCVEFTSPQILGTKFDQNPRKLQSCNFQGCISDPMILLGSDDQKLVKRGMVYLLVLRVVRTPGIPLAETPEVPTSGVHEQFRSSGRGVKLGTQGRVTVRPPLQICSSQNVNKFARGGGVSTPPKFS